jgi:hypothetical protein
MSLPQAALTCFHHSGRHHHPSLYALHSIAWYGILMSARSAVWYWSRFRLQVMSKPCSAKNSFSFLQVSRSYAAPLLRESTMGSTSKVLAILLQIGVPCKRISNGGSLALTPPGDLSSLIRPPRDPLFSIFIKNGREPAKLLRT